MNYKQQGTLDCGLFCLGYIEYISRKINPFNLQFDQSRMRAEYINFSNTKIFDSQNFEIQKKNNSNDRGPNIKPVILSLDASLEEIVKKL